MNLTYIIGEPGVGKSHLVERLTAGHTPEETNSPFAMRRYDNGVTELGRRRDAFSGTDALAMSVQPVVLEYLRAVQPKLVLAEGDRLGNNSFFNAVRALGYDLFIYHLDGMQAAAKGRTQRGSNQDETWLKGRRTKLWNVVAGQPGVMNLAARMPFDYYTELMLDPVTRAFTGKVVAQQPLEVW